MLSLGYEIVTSNIILAVKDNLRILGSSEAPIVVAFSGGVDSTVLLKILSQLIDPHRIIAWHIQHGLSDESELWPKHCAQQANSFGVRFGTDRIMSEPVPGENIEAWARKHRYNLLTRAVQRHQAVALITAHHADDQIETILLNCSRGVGPKAFLGMEKFSFRKFYWLLRPLLSCFRAEIESFAMQLNLAWVEDPMNQDTKGLRVLFRKKILPAWKNFVPGMASGILASVDLLRDSVVIAEEAIKEDLGTVSCGHNILDVLKLLALGPYRRRTVFHNWLRLKAGIPPKSSALQEWLRQLESISLANAQKNCSGSQMSFVLGKSRFRLYRGCLWAESSSGRDWISNRPSSFHKVWRGEKIWDLPDWQARVHFLHNKDCPSDFVFRLIFGEYLLRKGFLRKQLALLSESTKENSKGNQMITKSLRRFFNLDDFFRDHEEAKNLSTSYSPKEIVGSFPFKMLFGMPLVICSPSSSLRLRLKSGRESVSLKNIFQALSVPSWLRPGFPVILGQEQLLYVSGMGMNCLPKALKNQDYNFFCSEEEGDPIFMVWEPYTESDSRLEALSGYFRKNLDISQ